MTEPLSGAAAPAQPQKISRFHTVCKRVIRAAPDYFPRAEYQGKTIYFCTESCLEAFLADPERFYCAHSHLAKKA